MKQTARGRQTLDEDTHNSLPRRNTTSAVPIGRTYGFCQNGRTFSFGGPAWLGGHSEGQNTRSHPELGRENPQRRWYCVLRRGRVGRCQALQALPQDGTQGRKLTRGGAAR